MIEKVKKPLLRSLLKPIKTGPAAPSDPAKSAFDSSFGEEFD